MCRASHLYRVFLTVIALQIAGVGCEKQPDLGKRLPKPTAKAENGWPLYEVTSENFAIAVPEGWVGFEANPETMEQMIEQVAASNPGMAAYKETIRQQLKAGLRFFAMDEQAAKSGSGTNVIVMKTAMMPGMSLKEMADLSAKEIAQVYTMVGPQKRERKKTPHGESERLDFTMEIKTPDGRGVKVTQTQYYFLSKPGDNKSDLFVIGVTTLPEKAGPLAETITTICESFRPLKK